MNPLTDKDIREVIDIALDILQEHYSHRYDAHHEMKITNVVNIRHMLELLRIGRKYRKQEFLSRT